MRLHNLLALAVVASLAAGVAHASTTVTLTGSCSGVISNGSARYVNFTLVNTGNGDAVNASLFATAASPYGLSSQTVETAQALAPGKPETFTFYLQNLTERGTYGFGVYVSYSQDQQQFTVSFPCIVAFDSAAVPLLRIENLSVSGGKATVDVLNLGIGNVSGELYFMAPPSLQVSPRSASFELAPQGSSVLDSSLVRTGAYNGTVTLSAVVSYAYNGTVNSYMVSGAVALQQQQGSVDLTWAVIAIVVVAVVALIIASVFINRKR